MVSEIIVIITKKEEILMGDNLSGIIKKIDEQIKKINYRPHVKIIFK